MCFAVIWSALLHKSTLLLLFFCRRCKSMSCVCLILFSSFHWQLPGRQIAAAGDDDAKLLIILKLDLPCLCTVAAANYSKFCFVVVV